MINMANLIFSTNGVITLFYLCIAMISILIYGNANTNYYKTNQKIHSLKSFFYIYKLIQFSTLLICLLSIWFDNRLLFKLFYNSEFLKYLGVSISALSISVFSIARFTIGKNYSPCYDSYIPKSINTKGIYSIIRHPIYTSNLLLMIGIFISSGSLIILSNAIILFIYYFISAFIEEMEIEKEFPSYKMYKSRTGMFFPIFVRS